MSDASHSQLFLGRQPILGRDQQLSAYELLFRDGSGALLNRAQVFNPIQATATVIANAFTEMTANEALGTYRGFINIDDELLFSDLLEALPKERVVLEILEDIKPTPEVIARCQELSDQGFVLAMDDIVHANDSYRRLFDLSSIIKVDIMNMDTDFLRALVLRLKKYGKQLLAEKVETLKEFNYCKRLGFDLFQGYYFAKPTIIIGKKINASRMVIVQLLGLLINDAETFDLENAFKLEPGLTLNLLRLTNSVSSGLSTRVTSLRHAITILGRKQLQRWLQLLLYTNPDGSESINPLLQLAATRGRLMELLCAHLNGGQREFADQAFMVGIMSLMPSLLGMRMENILEQIPISQTLKNALTHHTGDFGKLLLLAEATERSNPDLLEKMLVLFPSINAEILSTCLIKAFAWANNLAQEREE